MLKRLMLVILFSLAFAYIESSVVVYLRAIFQPQGFHFPLPDFALNSVSRRLILTEIGREAATLVLIATGAWLLGYTARQRWVYALIIFAVWDIGYYVWLKVLVNWPASWLDWDILFLIPVAWASPVLYPVVVALTMFTTGVIILSRDQTRHPVKLGWGGALILGTGCGIIVLSFCIGGSHITQPDYADYFHAPLFAAGYVLALLPLGRALAFRA